MNKQKTNWVSLLGMPNAGKSTLLNALVGQKVSIVTPKPQTTRNLIRGIKIIDSTQLIFVDTPGIFVPTTQAGKVMVKLAWQGTDGVDQVFLVTDVSRYNSEENLSIIKKLVQEKVRLSLIINKIDLIPKQALLALIDFMKEVHQFENIFLISALKKQGLTGLLDHLVKTASLEPWPFNQGEVTDTTLQFQMAEIIREKIFMNTHEEIPYKVEVEIVSIKEEPKLIRILADILVQSDAHKKIMIGKSASMIKKIGMQARKELEKAMNRKIFLATTVKVSKTSHSVG